MLTSDNNQLNAAAEAYIKAIKGVNYALELGYSEQTICDLETKEEEKQNDFIAVIHAMLPAAVLKSITNIRLYNAKVIDKYIMPHV